jgi:hypothetical protein
MFNHVRNLYNIFWRGIRQLAGRGSWAAIAGLGLGRNRAGLCRYLLMSGVLHCTAIGLLSVGPQVPKAKQPAVQVLQLAIIQAKHTAINLQKLSRISPRIARLGSEAYQSRHTGLSQHLLADNYLARLHAHIDPNWQYRVRLARQQASCTTVLEIDADANGTVLAVNVAANTCPARLLAVAKDTLWACNLEPPPKQLLVRGRLLLEWTFVLHD